MQTFSHHQRIGRQVAAWKPAIGDDRDIVIWGHRLKHLEHEQVEYDEDRDEAQGACEKA